MIGEDSVNETVAGAPTQNDLSHNRLSQSAVTFRRQTTEVDMIFGRYRNLHFVGIGGAGMSGMAEILADIGFTISGSDNTPTEVTERLQEQGITVHQGHSAANIGGVDLVVISAAVDSTNAEVAEAHRLGIPVIKRAEMLGELMRLKYSIGIAGAHGKTTTTALTGAILKSAGVDPTVIVGGRVTDESIGAKVGAGEYLVAEADEFDRSFLVMFPTIAVATNLEEDHRDCYRDLADLKDAFCEYLNRTPFYGQIILNADDTNLMDLVPRLKRPVVTFSLNEGQDSKADYSVVSQRQEAGRTVFTLAHREDVLGELVSPLPGEHNLYNALCAACIALELEIPFAAIQAGLSEFGGVLRRFERIGEVKSKTSDVVVYDDYAHHPTEVSKAISAAKEFGKHVTVVFQPHLFTRTRDFAADFALALAAADEVIIVDIYPAREKPIEGVTAELISIAAKEKGLESFSYVGAMENAVSPAVTVSLKAKDSMIFTMGAGNVCRLTGALLSELKKRAGRTSS